MYKQVKDGNGVVKTNVILRTADNVYIPNDLGNHDWVAYQAWLGLGNTPEAAS